VDDSITNALTEAIHVQMNASLVFKISTVSNMSNASPAINMAQIHNNRCNGENSSSTRCGSY